MTLALRSNSACRLRSASARFFQDSTEQAYEPEDILRFWIGHADVSVTDRYSKMSKRIQSRKDWAEKAGLGFNLPELCTQCTKKSVVSTQENAA
jgi:hypothetical protein